MSSKKAVTSFFIVSGLVLGGGVAGLPLFAKANNWDGGEFMLWLEESKMFRVVNRFVGSNKKSTERDDEDRQED